MNILFATPEAAPLWSSGGLGHVAAELPEALARRGHRVRRILPLYAAIRRRKPSLRPLAEIPVPWPGGGRTARYFSLRSDAAAETVLVDAPGLLDVERPYGPGPDPLAPARRYAFFCRAVLHWAAREGSDLIHLNDWQTGLVPTYALLDDLPVATVFTIHNLAYQGNFAPLILDEIGVPRSLFRTENGLELFGHASFLKAGLALADALVTVSPTYAREILRPDQGTAMDGLLRFRRRRLWGILNGIDPRVWDPSNDAALPRAFGPRALGERDENRAALMRELELDPRSPLFIMIARLVKQKGVGLILDALPRLAELPVRLAIMGDGDRAYHQALAGWAARYPRRIALRPAFDDDLARLMYAGADFYLMPSLFEPCGLAQMIAQRYGAVPVARRTGGLADTIIDGETGLLFDAPEADALVAAIKRARALWRGAGWDALRRRCMEIRRPWEHAAARYETVYRAALGSAAPDR